MSLYYLYFTKLKCKKKKLQSNLPWFACSLLCSHVTLALNALNMSLYRLGVKKTLNLYKQPVLYLAWRCKPPQTVPKQPLLCILLQWSGAEGVELGGVFADILRIQWCDKIYVTSSFKYVSMVKYLCVRTHTPSPNSTACLHFLCFNCNVIAGSLSVPLFRVKIYGLKT